MSLSHPIFFIQSRTLSHLCYCHISRPPSSLILYVSFKLFNSFQHPQRSDTHIHTHTQDSPQTPSSLPRQRYSAHCHGNIQSPSSHNPFPSHNEYLTRFTLGGFLYGGWVCDIFCTKHTHYAKYHISASASFAIFDYY